MIRYAAHKLGFGLSKVGDFLLDWAEESDFRAPKCFQDSPEKLLHPFERNVRKDFEGAVFEAAEVLKCDTAHVRSIVTLQLRALIRGVSDGQADDAKDIKEARDRAIEAWREERDG